MIRTHHMNQTKGLGAAPAIVFGFALAALVAIGFSEGVLPVEGSAARPTGEVFPWAMLR